MRTVATKEQEEALCALYESWGYEKACADILKHLETKFSNVHSVVIDARKLLTDNSKILRDKSRQLGDESKLTDFLIARINSL